MPRGKSLALESSFEIVKLREGWMWEPEKTELRRDCTERRLSLGKVMLREALAEERSGLGKVKLKED